MRDKLTITTSPLLQSYQFFLFDYEQRQNGFQEVGFEFQWKHQNHLLSSDDFLDVLKQLIEFCETLIHQSVRSLSLKKMFAQSLSPLEIKQYQQILPILAFQWEQWPIRDLLKHLIFFERWLSLWLVKKTLVMTSVSTKSLNSWQRLFGYQLLGQSNSSQVVQLMVSSSSSYWVLRFQDALFSFCVDWRLKVDVRDAPSKLKIARQLIENLTLSPELGQFFWIEDSFFPSLTD